MNEFDIIKKYFRKSTHHRTDVIVGSGDDAAILQPPKDQVLVSTIDANNVDVHFFADTPPQDIGYKSVAVSFSDLAAMGAEPAWMVATLSIPQVDEQWLHSFSEGFYELLDEFNVALVGGDLVRGPLAISTQLTGFVPPDCVLRRDGARKGDSIFVTGTIGDARQALDALRANNTPDDLLLTRLRRPTPRVQEGIALRGIASSAIDLSDGLTADLQHLLHDTTLGADIDVQKVPRTGEAIDHQTLLNAGDDYELLFTVPPEKENQLASINCTKIGVITDTGQVRVSVDQQYFSYNDVSWRHFD